MLQRIQTVFLLFIIIFGVVFTFFPMIEFQTEEATYVMNAYKTTIANSGDEISKNMGVGVMQGLIILLSIIIILLFKNRGLQIKLAKLNLLFIALQIAAIAMYLEPTKLAIGVVEVDILVYYNWTLAIPIVSLILNYLAIRFIKKDDDLIRSANRLR